MVSIQLWQYEEADLRKYKLSDKTLSSSVEKRDSG